MCILVCFYVELLRLPLTRAAHLRAAPVVAASRTENLRLALSPASKACVWTPRHRRVSWTLKPLLRDSVDIAVECVHPIQGR